MADRVTALPSTFLSAWLQFSRRIGRLVLLRTAAISVLQSDFRLMRFWTLVANLGLFGYNLGIGSLPQTTVCAALVVVNAVKIRQLHRETR